MTRPGTDLAVERIVLDGVDLDEERARRLGRLVEEELRLIAAGGGLRPDAGTTLVDAAPVSLARPVEIEVLARVLARRIAAEVSAAEASRV